jgi:hypothetical protein
MRKRRQAQWTFVCRAAVEPTNNRFVTFLSVTEYATCSKGHTSVLIRKAFGSVPSAPQVTPHYIHQLLHSLMVCMFPQSSLLPCAGDYLTFIFVIQIVPDQFRTFFGGAVHDDFLARLEHLMQVLLPIGNE